MILGPITVVSMYKITKWFNANATPLDVDPGTVAITEKIQFYYLKGQ